MKQTILVIAISLSLHLAGFTQQIPIGSCGIVYIHDATGARTKRVYFCNNGIDPYPQFTTPKTKDEEKLMVTEAFTFAEKKSLVFQEVDALYPNPTSGLFYITFSKALVNASISIIDVNGKVVQKYPASGLKLTCDLSRVASGTYFVRIEEDGKLISKKVIKQ